MMYKTRSEKKFDRLEQEGLRWCYGKKGGSAPPPPDYTAAAIASGEASKEVTEQQTWANRPDQFTPWGSTTWQNQQVWDPSTQQYLNRWAQTTNLTPDAQEALDSQLNLQKQRSQLGESLYDRMESEYADPMDWSGLTPWGKAPQYQNAGNLNLQGAINTGGMQGVQIGAGATDPQLQNYQKQQFSGDLEYDPTQIRQRAEDAMYSQAISRLDPQWEQATSDMEAKLAAQGLRPGDPAYDRQMENLNRAKTDAYNQAQWSATDAGRQEAGQLWNQQLGAGQFANQAAEQRLSQELGIGSQRFQEQMGRGEFQLQEQQQRYQQQMQQRQNQFMEEAQRRGMSNQEAQAEWDARRKQYDTQFNQQLQGANYQNTLRQAQLAEQMQQRGFTLNEINALLTNQQVGMPQMPQFSQASSAQATDYLGAANMGYQANLDAFNAQQAGSQGFLSGLGGVASGLGALGWAPFSDRRLKHGVKKLGKFLGLNVYRWTYLWGEQAVGFMADEVKKVFPDAVTQHESGYDMVNYNTILERV